MPSLLHDSEVCVIYFRLKTAGTFPPVLSNMNLVGFNWKMANSNEEVLQKNGSRSIESMILQRLLVQGETHLVRMVRVRSVKQIWYGKLNNRNRPKYEPKLRLTDCIKVALKETKLQLGIGKMRQKNEMHGERQSKMAILRSRRTKWSMRKLGGNSERENLCIGGCVWVVQV